MQEVNLTREEGEPLGMHIKGGTDNPGNPLNKDDTGIFISKILPGGAVNRCGLARVSPENSNFVLLLSINYDETTIMTIMDQTLYKFRLECEYYV
jgi:hypothetical protein